MADYTESKNVTGEVYPPRQIDQTAWRRVEPLVTPDRIRNEFLFGIPLVSQIPDPITKKKMVMTDPMIQKLIEKSVDLVEQACSMRVFPVQFREKHPFDKNLYEAFGYFLTNERPVSNINKLSMVPANDVEIYVIPLDWVETNYLHKGQLNIIPLAAAASPAGGVNSLGGGALFLALLSTNHWIPAFWQIEYTAGFPDGQIPVVVNELVGTITALKILSQLGATFGKSTSTSLSIDGVSQSIGSPGPNVFKVRIEELEQDRKELIRAIKRICGTSINFNSI
jgi:hypothetical protein